VVLRKIKDVIESASAAGESWPNPLPWKPAAVIGTISQQTFGGCTSSTQSLSLPGTPFELYTILERSFFVVFHYFQSSVFIL